MSKNRLFVQVFDTFAPHSKIHVYASGCCEFIVFSNRALALVTIESINIDVFLLRLQCLGGFGVVFYGLITEPPVNLFPVHIRLYLVGGVWIELATGHTSGQHR